MNSLIAWIKRHPIVTFFALAYTFSWLPWVLGTLIPASRPFVLYPFLGGGPLLAALVVIPLTQGGAGLCHPRVLLLSTLQNTRFQAIRPKRIDHKSGQASVGLGVP